MGVAVAARAARDRPAGVGVVVIGMVVVGVVVGRHVRGTWARWVHVAADPKAAQAASLARIASITAR
jgi:uncharacterized protein (DUF983 family)